MRPVARFTTRLQGEGDGLFIGALMKPGTFKPNTVYEIIDIFGDLVIREVGQASGAGSENCAGKCLGENGTQFHWACDIGDIIGRQGKHMFLSLAEYKQLLDAERKRMVDL